MTVQNYNFIGNIKIANVKCQTYLHDLIQDFSNLLQIKQKLNQKNCRKKINLEADFLWILAVRWKNSIRTLCIQFASAIGNVANVGEQFN